MRKIVVSIITRTRNRLPFLLRAKKSILSQTYKNFEWIIVNDGGDNDCLKYLFGNIDDNETNVKEIRLRENVGRSAAANIGISKSNGKYIILHDDDDSWKPNFLMKTVSFLEGNQYYNGVVVHTYRVDEIFNENDGTIKEISIQSENFFVNNLKISEMAQRNLFSPISFLYRKDAWLKIGGYREDLDVIEDYDFNLRFLINVGDIGLIKERLANHHFRWRSHSDPNYNNTMTQGIDQHYSYHSFYKNKLLREDIKNNRIGLGILLSLADMTVESSELFRTVKFYKDLFLLKKERFLKIFKRKKCAS